jgi:hypothetical protein
MVEKLITVTIWATLALIAYEVFKSLSASAPLTNQTGGAPVNTSALNSLFSTLTGNDAIGAVVGDTTNSAGQVLEPTLSSQENDAAASLSNPLSGFGDQGF